MNHTSVSVRVCQGWLYSAGEAGAAESPRVQETGPDDQTEETGSGSQPQDLAPGGGAYEETQDARGGDTQTRMHAHARMGR